MVGACFNFLQFTISLEPDGNRTRNHVSGRTDRSRHSEDCSNALSACDRAKRKKKKGRCPFAKSEDRENFHFEIQLNDEETSCYKLEITSLAVANSKNGILNPAREKRGRGKSFRPQLQYQTSTEIPNETHHR